ncbi:beta strand repeat-containing protein, partial [Prosthecobacter sp.]
MSAQTPYSCGPAAELAQQRYWFFGTRAGLDFGTTGTGPVSSALSTANPLSLEGTVTATNSSGVLQFFAGPTTVYNATGAAMANGTGLVGNTSSGQGAVAFQRPGYPNHYFLITNQCGVALNDPNGNLYYHQIDMAQNGGLGAVTTKNVLLGAANTASEALAAVPNHDGSKAWVLTATNGANRILAYEFDRNGPTGVVVTTTLSSNNGLWFGTLRFSADMSKVVQLSNNNGETTWGPTQIRLLNFNAQTGQLTENWTMTIPSTTLGSAYGADFSPNGNYIYVSSIGSGGLFQYDLASNTGAGVLASGVRLATSGSIGNIRRAPNGKMYVANLNQNTISVINSPNTGGVGADFVLNGLSLAAGQESEWGLPEMVQGCTVALVDTDTDGTPDLDDLDDDNDGILDTLETIQCENTLITPVSATSSPVYANGSTADKTINSTGFTGTGLAALATAPGTLDDSWLLQENLTAGFIEYTIPLSNVGGVVLWAPDAFNYPGGDAPIKDFTVTLFYGNNQTYTSPMYTTAKPTGSGSLPGAQVFTLPASFSNVSKVRLNITAGWYDLDENNANFVSTDTVSVRTNYNMFLGEFRVLCGSVQPDTDNDGIPDRLDLDSDGDGCPDAIEGGGSFTTGNLVTSTLAGGNSGAGYTGTATSPVTQNLGNTVGSTVTTLGVPTVAGTGQNIGLSQNGALNACLDTDIDGIIDVDDLDDDNDGILDSIELGCLFNQVVSKTGVIVTQSPDVTYTLNTGYTLSNLVDGVDSNVFVARPTGDLTNKPLLTFEFPTPKVLTYLEVGHFSGQYLFSLSSTYKIQASNDNTTWFDLTGTLTYNNASTSTSGGLSTSNSNIASFTSNTDYYKFYRIFGLAAAPGNGWATEVYFKESDCLELDLDGDTVPNTLDLDSDGDGCPDAIEGAASFTTANTTGTGALSGSVSVSGVPTIAGFGQAIGSSQNPGVQDPNCPLPDSEGDGVPDITDLDDDNDGILDAVEAPTCYYTASEANVIESISTGLTISTGTTSLLSNGVLTTATPNFAFTAGQALANANLFTVTYPTPVNLTSLTIVNATSLGASATAKLQGSLNGTTWVDLTSAAVSLSTTANKIFTVNQNAGEYPYYRILGVATATSLANPIFEITSILNTPYDPSAHPKAICILDTDNDGIPNDADLDSDGDGCPDAIEGGASFVAANLTATKALSGAVSATGIPTIAGSGQAIGTSQNASVQDANCPPLDSDGDSVTNSADLDDDNDGILDTVENAGCAILIPPTNVGTKAIITVPTGWSIVTSTPDLVDVTSSPYGVWNIGCTNTAPAAPNGHTKFVFLGANTQESFKTTVNYLNVGQTYQFTYYQGNFGGFNFSPGEVTVKLGSTTIDQFTPVQGCGWSTRVISFTATATSQELSFTATGTSNQSAIISVSEDAINAGECDTDNDGIPNRLDLDSDGDGCSDAIEGGASFTAANLVTSTLAGGNSGAGYTGTSTTPVTQNLGNTVGSTVTTLGVPTVAGTGQSIGFSQSGAINGCLDTDTDGTPNIEDVDDDNDGVLDTAEQSCAQYETLGNCTTTNFVQTLGIFTHCSGWNAFDFDPSASVDRSDFDFMALVDGKVRFDLQGSYVTPVTGKMIKVINPVTAGVAYTYRINLASSFIDIEGSKPYLRAVNNVDGSIISSLYLNGTGLRDITFIAPSSSISITVGFDTRVGNGGSLFWEDVGLLNSNGQVGSTCTDIDTDGDGTPNRLDLDSDGDGCPDAVEAGATFISTSGVAAANQSTASVIPAPYGTNGFANGLETVTDNGTYKGTYSYSNATNALLSGCADTDSDGINNVFDLDDDNDGVLDTVESACLYNQVVSKTGVIVTKSATVGYTFNGAVTLANLVDGVDANVIVMNAPTGVLNNNALLTFEFPTPKVLTYLEVGHFANQHLFSLSTTYKVQASNDNTNWFDLTGTLTYNNVATSTSGGLSSSNSNIATFATNTNSYKYYRLFGLAAAPGVGWATEVYFKESICLDLDTDGDTVPNTLDLDSDGDGCADAIEGGAAFTAANTTATGALSGSVSSAAATLGVPTLAGTGQAVGTSQNSAINACTDTDGDGIANVVDVDDDNDGILDINEQGCIQTVGTTITPIGVTSTAVAAGDVINNYIPSITRQFPVNISMFPNGAPIYQTYEFTNTLINPIIAFADVDYARQEWTDEFDNPLTLLPLDVSPATVVSGNVITRTNLTIAGGAPTTSAYGRAQVLGSYNKLKVKYLWAFPSNNNDSHYLAFVQPNSCNETLDTDGDTVPNTLDLDSDGDGCPDAIEGGASFTTANSTGTGALSGSVSVTGVPTIAGSGQTIGTSQNASAQDANCPPPDPDIDGVPYFIDLDDDNDGIPDTVEAANALNGGDTDGDGIPDTLDLDSDGDGILDFVEARNLTPAQIATLDANGDGRLDGAVGTDGIPDSVQTTPNAGTVNYTPLDTDADGNPDFQDLDSDNDGISDVVEASPTGVNNDTNGDGKADGTVNTNGVASMPNTTALGLGTPDTDGDGKPDFRDLDSDNDG